MPRLWVLFAVCSAVSCGPSPSASEPRSDVREVVTTGRECAPAHIACEPGRCVAEVHNGCDTPVTCQLHIESLCETDGGEVGPANTSTKHFTQRKGSKRSLEAHTTCGQGHVVLTKVTRVECI
jgi:hypothetical protein